MGERRHWAGNEIVDVFIRELVFRLHLWNEIFATFLLATSCRSLPLARLDCVLPHVHGSGGSMQLLVEAARVTDGRALRIGGPPPQRGLVGVTVDAAGVRAKAKVFLLNKIQF